MKKTLTKILTFIFILLVASSCNSSGSDKDLMLYLSFDEGSGNKVEDKAKNLDTATFNMSLIIQSSNLATRSQWREKVLLMEHYCLMVFKLHSL